MVCGALCCGPTAYATVPDPAFVETPIVNGLGTITGLGRPPDGSDRMFVILKDGTVRVIEGGVLLPAPFATITPILTANECGLIGMAFDPDFVSNHYVYFFVSVSVTEQQIQRYTDVSSVGMAPSLVLGGLPTRGANHNGGGLGFGPDGKFYWSIGDISMAAGVPTDLVTLRSKVGRANLDGTAPTDNPFYDGAGPNNDYIWARGFRNPFTMTFHPRNGKLISNTVGELYEQVFIVSAGDDAGWNIYENNQPAGYLLPIIAYRTNTVDIRPINTVSRASGVLTVRTTVGNRFRRGMRVTLAGVADPSFDGDVLVGTILTPFSFSALQAGPDAMSTGGTATNQGFGGSITGGTFYDSTGFDPIHRGAFFFGDFNTGQLMRAPFDTQFQVESVDVFGTDFGATVDAEVAADGALWVGEVGGSIYEIQAAPTVQGLIVTPRNLRAVEGGGAALAVRLAIAPSAPVVVAATMSGDPDVSLVAGAALTFDSLDWDVPQPVVLATAFDGDATADTATVTISSVGIASEAVLVQVRDRPQPDGGALDANEADATTADGAALDAESPDLGPGDGGDTGLVDAGNIDSGSASDAGASVVDAATALDNGSPEEISAGCACEGIESRSSSAWWAVLPWLLGRGCRRKGERIAK